MRIRLFASVPALAVLAVAVGCSGQPGSPQSKPTSFEAPKQFSAREVEAARKLSLAGDVVLPNGYARELRCYSAIVAVEEMLRTSRVLGQDQLRQFVSARETFARRARRAGEAEGIDRSAINTALDDRPGKAGDLKAQASTAIACLRDLEEGA